MANDHDRRPPAFVRFVLLAVVCWAAIALSVTLARAWLARG